MNISPFEIIAQIFNFLILMYLMNRLLYKPVTETMRKRQEEITMRLDEAERMEMEAKELIGSYRKRMAGIDEEKRLILDKANEEAEARKEELVEGFREEALKKRRSFLDEVESEKERLSEDLRASLARNANLIAGGILKEVSGEDLSMKALDTFLKRIRELEPEEGDLSGVELRPLIKSAREIDEGVKDAIRGALAERLGMDKEPVFSVDSTLGEGYLLRLETRLVEVSMRRYLEESLDKVMKAIGPRKG
ncbi:F0F1 ATP synthase subunit B family protein [Youngiibacter fragilis]|uniref:ATP synthase subunit b n=1 Tax=Youngiibacter fragilis 232.1 TaxID=994573 RepID=V7I7E6_9CLOT|nr:hypothetical protein [Youngiibacter fragilis]ETA81196.1 hypothetical protein T472_0207705 [Youngiibacter fragilis 232.1]